MDAELGRGLRDDESAASPSTHHESGEGRVGSADLDLYQSPPSEKLVWVVKKPELKGRVFSVVFPFAPKPAAAYARRLLRRSRSRREY